MQFTLLCLSALVASISAQETTASTPDIVSVLSVLQTALPSSLLQEAITNSAAASSEIASEFAAGSTPAWFSNLPSGVKTFLVPLATDGAALSSALGNATASGISTFNGTVVGSNATTTVGGVSTGNSTVLTTSSAAGTTSTGSTSAGTTTTRAGSASATTGSSSSSSSAGAAMPTALYGMGLAGAVGLVGVLAL